MTVSTPTIVEAEQEFHDRWARGVHPERVPVGASFYLPTCPENRFIARQFGPVRRKRLLELGAGLGEASVYFAVQGADVFATDVSPRMLQLARQVAQLHRVVIHPIEMDGAYLAVPSASVDFVYGANMLHHVDTAVCLREVHRVLKPGGKAAFWDPLRYNPIINIYRRMANQVRSIDEHPLGRQEWRLMRSLFTTTHIQFSWLFTLGVFLRFYLWDQVHPNEERYWKKIIYDYPQLARLYAPLYQFDQLLLRLPGVRWLAWNMTVVLTK